MKENNYLHPDIIVLDTNLEQVLCASGYDATPGGGLDEYTEISGSWS